MLAYHVLVVAEGNRCEKNVNIKYHGPDGKRSHRIYFQICLHINKYSTFKIKWNGILKFLLLLNSEGLSGILVNFQSNSCLIISEWNLFICVTANLTFKSFDNLPISYNDNWQQWSISSKRLFSSRRIWWKQVYTAHVKIVSAFSVYALWRTSNFSWYVLSSFSWHNKIYQLGYLFLFW